MMTFDEFNELNERTKAYKKNIRRTKFRKLKKTQIIPDQEERQEQIAKTAAEKRGIYTNKMGKLINAFVAGASAFDNSVGRGIE